MSFFKDSEASIKNGSFFHTAVVVLFGMATIAVPLFFLTLTRDPFLLPKEILLVSIVLLALLLWLVPMTVFKTLYFRWSVFDIPLLLFAGWTLLSSVFSLSPARSFFGDPTQFVLHGAVILALCVWFWLFGQHVRKIRLWERFLMLFLVPGFFAGVLFLLQGIVPLSIIRLFVPDDAVSAISGTSSLFGMFVAITAVLALGLFMVRGASLSRSVWSAGAALVSVVVLIKIGFTVPWVIFAVGSALLLVIALSLTKDIRIPHAIAVSVLFVMSLFFIFLGTPDRIKAALPVEVALGASASWSITSMTVSDSIKSFLFGTGPGTFLYDFSQYRDALFNIHQLGSDIRFHQPFSLFMAVLAEFGVIGMAVFSFLILFGIGFLFRAWIETKPSAAEKIKLLFRQGMAEGDFSRVRLELFITGAVWIAATVGVFITFYDVSLLFAWWWLLAAMMTGVAILLPNLFHETYTRFEVAPQHGLAVSFGVVLVYGAVVLAGIFGYRLFLAEAAFTNAVKSVQPEETRRHIDAALAYRPRFAPYHTALARVHLDLGRRASNSADPDPEHVAGYVASAIDEARQATEYAPNDVRSWETLGAMYTAARGLAPDANAHARAAFERAIVLEPSNPAFHFQLGTVYQFEKETQNARKQYRQAIELHPAYLPAYMSLSALYEEQGDFTKAIEVFAPLGRTVDQNAELLYTIGRLLYNRREAGDAENAERAFLRAVELVPNYANALYSLGILYEEKGNRAKASEYFKRVLALHPQNTELQQKVNAFGR